MQEAPDEGPRFAAALRHLAQSVAAAAGTSSQWHGIRSFVRTSDGQTIEATETADQIAALVTKAEHAERYACLRERDLSTIYQGGVFAGKTPENVVLNGADLDAAIDAERASTGL